MGLLLGGPSDVLVASLMVGGGTATIVGSYSLSDRITLPRWVVNHKADTVRLWRPTGPEELGLVEASGWRAWPPRLPDQPIFYPVLSREYAASIARDWNVKRSGVGYVTTFEVKQSFLDKYQIQQVGGREILEYWIPAEDLADMNQNIVGLIEVVAEYR
ncbi:MAG TPA: hypothetical protein VN683_09645 [Acidothermaceae bacterium]|nr:hypothetical protein [Acidothermaceae bacterium]